MKRKVSIRSTRQLSKGSVIGIIFMILFGIGFTVLVGSVLRENEAPLAASAVFYLFMAGWLTTAVYLLVLHLKSIGRRQGMPLFEAESTEEPGSEAAETGFARRLRDLEKLHEDGLISKEEYSLKRSEILAEKW